MKLGWGRRLLVLRSPIRVYPLPTLLTRGITNHTRDNFFVFFADYDNVEYAVVREDADFYQKNFDMGTMLTRFSKEEKNDVGVAVGNYHLIGFPKFTFPAIKEIINIARCDEHFKVGYKYQQRCWVLRVAEKIDEKTGEVVRPYTKLKEVLPAPTNRAVSRAHIIFFEGIDHIKLLQYFMLPDKSLGVEVIDYETKEG